MFDFSSPWQEVLDYWFEDGLERGWPSTPATRKWFRATPGDDAEIEHRFGNLVEAALQQELVDWERHPLSRLALILVLDQFCRHIHRGTARAFAGDHRAATLSVEGVSRRMQEKLPLCGKVFFLMPLMHAEDEDLQDLCVTQMTTLQEQADSCWQENLESSLRSAHQHREIIRRFGRFPHRNQALGRDSTEKELKYLATASRMGQ
ncbi:MAG: DUF924 domain-containing protein [Pseudomonadales bacterium]|nr:DUF924 domain-containing protein [Pseudomonadales bacterium]